MEKCIWIIGSSSGIGLELVKIYLNAGYNVIASSTNAVNTTELLKLKDKFSNKLNLLNIDVSDEKSVKNCVEEAFNIKKCIDICFYNAGVYEVTNLDNLNINEHETMMNINFLGAIRVLKYFLTNRVESNKSTIVFNVSLSSYFGLPYGGAYSSTKAALVNYAQSIQPELIEKNVEVRIINHGFVKTRLTQKNDFDMPQLLEPSVAAKKIFEGLNKPYRFEIYFPFILSRVLRFISLIPYSLSFKITKRFLKPNSDKNIS